MHEWDDKRKPDLMKQFRTATVKDHRRLMECIMINKLNSKRIPLLLKKRGSL